MAWLILVLAGCFEIGWAVSLKYTDGFTKLIPTIWTIAAIIISMTLLGVALRSLPLGTAYAVWVGIGTVGTAAIGILWLGEPASVARLFFLVLVMIGILGLKFTSPARPSQTRQVDLLPEVGSFPQTPSQISEDV